MVAGPVQPLAEEPARQVGPPVVQQVHPGEGDLVGHVDPAQVLAELDAVEGQHPATLQDHVAQVQVAVALAHHARLPALDPVHQWRHDIGGHTGAAVVLAAVAALVPVHRRGAGDAGDEGLADDVAQVAAGLADEQSRGLADRVAGARVREAEYLASPELMARGRADAPDALRPALPRRGARPRLERRPPSGRPRLVSRTDAARLDA